MIDRRTTRIALIGLPGVGKTTVGDMLAQEFDWTFFDCDAAFESKTGASITDWVDKHGWAAFRERESEILDRAMRREHVIVSTGGGVVENKSNCAALAAAAAVVWLDASLEVLVARLAESEARPLLAGNSSARLAKLAERRNPLYAALADVRMDVADVSAAAVVARIVKSLRRD